jgi:predicted enzyme related to lactoylglutathione lyase
MTTPRHAITWFEIPVHDMDRAQRFYEGLLDTRLDRQTMEGLALAVFPSQPGGVQGCLQAFAEPMPVQGTATLVYLDANPSLDAVLARVPRVGGRIVTPRTELPAGMGCFAHIEDSEGNRVGLHALKA